MESKYEYISRQQLDLFSSSLNTQAQIEYVSVVQVGKEVSFSKIQISCLVLFHYITHIFYIW